MAPMTRTLRLYPAYQLARQLHFWLPVHMLFFTEQVGLARALELEAIYYLGFVLLEVPSGYLADRMGRRVTLILGALAAMAAHAAFVFGQGFVHFAVAQVLLALSMASVSGSDVALLYDTLAASGDTERFAAVEGRAQSWAFSGLAGAALVSGVIVPVASGLGGWPGDALRLAFALSLLGQLVAFALACAMVEPPATRSTSAFTAQLGDCLRATRRSPLGWVLALYALATVINHVPYELYQPYLRLLTAHSDIVTATPLASGTLLALTMLVAGAASRGAAALGARVGAVTALVGTLALQVAVIWSLGLALHWAVMLPLLLRSIPAAAQRPLVGAMVNPHLPSEVRATYLSLMSLVGRLCFALALVAAAIAVGDRALVWSVVAELAIGFAVFGGAASICLAVLAPRD